MNMAIFSRNYSNFSEDYLLALSMQSLRLRLWANAVIIALGLMALFSNSFLMVIVWKSKTLHTKCFFLIAANGFVDLVLGVTYGITAAKRIYRYANGSGEVMSRWACFCEVSVNAYFQLVALNMAAVLVIDRTIAIVRPILYQKLSYRRLTIPLLLFAMIYSLIQFLINLYDSYNGPASSTIFSCGIDDTVSEKALAVLMSVQIITSLIVVALNIALAVVIKKKYTRSQIGSGNSRGDREDKVFKSITATVLMHIFVYLAGRLFIVAEGDLLRNQMMETMAFRYVRDLAVLSAAVNCFFLFGTSTEFRTAAKKLCKFTGNTVEPAVGAV